MVLPIIYRPLKSPTLPRGTQGLDQSWTCINAALRPLQQNCLCKGQCLMQKLLSSQSAESELLQSTQSQTVTLPSQGPGTISEERSRKSLCAGESQERPKEPMSLDTRGMTSLWTHHSCACPCSYEPVSILTRSRNEFMSPHPLTKVLWIVDGSSGEEN